MMSRTVKMRGFALPAVIFLMVIVTLLIAYMARIQVAQSADVDMRLLAVKAYWAAKAGGEMAAYRINSSAVPANGCTAAAGTQTIDGFQVSVGCQSNSYAEGSGTVTVYEVTVQATSGAAVTSQEYVSRQLTLVLNVES